MRFLPDIIVAWPKHVDYPLWRKQIHDNRHRFGKVIIVFTDMNAGGDYRNFIQDQMKQDNIIFCDNDPVRAGDDWRNLAVNKGLGYSDSQWVWFTEQDFYMYKPDEFWQGIEDCLETGADVIGYMQGGVRLHPCCIFIRRFVLDNFTRKDFGVVPDKHDHFYLLEEDLINAPDEVDVFRITEAAKMDWFEHLNGLSQNIHMLQSGDEPNYDVEKFTTYVKTCVSIVDTFPMPSDMLELFTRYVERRTR